METLIPIKFWRSSSLTQLTHQSFLTLEAPHRHTVFLHTCIHKTNRNVDSVYIVFRSGGLLMT